MMSDTWHSHREGRVLFTQDADFLRLHAAGQGHHGIVYAPQQTAVGSIVSGLMLIFDPQQSVEFEAARGGADFWPGNRTP